MSKKKFIPAQVFAQRVQQRVFFFSLFHHFFLPDPFKKGVRGRCERSEDDIRSRLSALVARVGLSLWDCLVELVILVNVFPTFSGLSAILKGVLGRHTEEVR
jgi:hypothetical protein